MPVRPRLPGPPSLGFIRHQTTQMASLKEALKFVRKIIAENDFPQGFTTAELLKLAQKEPAPPGFHHVLPTPVPRKNTHTGLMNPVYPPSRPDHPVRSAHYLKTAILPVLEGAGEIVMTCTPRTYTTTFGLPQAAPKKRRKGKQDPRVMVEASEEAPVTTKVWSWKKVDPSVWNSAKQSAASAKANAEREAAKKEPPSPYREVGLADDVKFLSRKRERARQKKIANDISVMRVLRLEKEGLLGKSMALSSQPLSSRFNHIP